MDAAHMVLTALAAALGWWVCRERRARREAQSLIAWRDELDRRRNPPHPGPTLPAWYDEED
jgi:hypothetical protein